MSDDNFNCNGAHYVNFNALIDDQNADAFFEQNEQFCPLEDDLNARNIADRSSDEEDGDFFTPTSQMAFNFSKMTVQKLRRSSSAGQLHLNKSTDSNDNIARATKKEEHPPLLGKKGNSYAGNEQKVPRKFHSQEHIDRLAQPKKKQETNNNFVSMAEGVLKYQKATPKRFKGGKEVFLKPSLVFPKRTIPSSPCLKTKNRHRPISALTREEQEQLEVEEMQKFKIKAHPLNKKILHEPVKVIPLKKPTTEPQPFHLTEVRKAKHEETAAPVFHANPVPKTIYHPTIEVKSRHPIAPKLKPSLKLEEPKPLKRTVLKPFSFEKRDLELLKKKEELANAAKVEPPTFKARSPKVLTSRPFVPKKAPHYIEISEFNLATDERQQAWERVQKQRMEKELKREELQRKAEEERRQMEEQEIKQLRKQAVHKAQPVKKYKNVEIVPTFQFTLAESPKFHYGAKNKENLAPK